MSWIDKVSGRFTIKTGDGSLFDVLWKSTGRSVEYNLSKFEFPNVKGSLVKRGEVMGTQIQFEIYFDGDDHLDNADAFKRASEDPRAWTVSHPQYGVIYCHPTSLAFDDTDYNVTKVTGTIIETITDDKPKVTVSIQDTISSIKATSNDVNASGFSNDVSLSPADVNDIVVINQQLYNIGKKRIKLSIDAEKYFNLFNSSYTAILNSTSDPLTMAKQIQAMIDAPALFEDGVEKRLEILIDQGEYLRESLDNNLSYNKKRIYELFGGTVVSATAQAASTPQEGDYTKRPEVLSIVNKVLLMYNQYLFDIDRIQTDNGGDIDSYIADFDGIYNLDRIIHYTVSRLFDIALDSKQERQVFLEKDSNIIEIAHRFYGLDASDSNIDLIMEQNNFGLNDLIRLPKGRKIIYYV
ncbi:MAG: hypothetical protein EBW87_00120 [Burkholderiaceae bacterium]|nr:hypothetical protein [Burkholderiaceae bacterium]